MIADATITTPDGRLFTLVRQESYTRVDGSVTPLLVWESLCQVCAAPFEVTSPPDPSTSKAFGLMHCGAHKLSKAEVKARWLAGIARARKARKAAK